MFPASFNRSPVVWVLTTRSLPAKSTILNLLFLSGKPEDGFRGVRCTLIVKIEWERDETRFARVENTRRFAWPRERTDWASWKTEDCRVSWECRWTERRGVAYFSAVNSDFFHSSNDLEVLTHCRWRTWSSFVCLQAQSASFDSWEFEQVLGTLWKAWEHSPASVSRANGRSRGSWSWNRGFEEVVDLFVVNLRVYTSKFVRSVTCKGVQAKRTSLQETQIEYS